ncbi:MAG: glycosyltransferase family 2 protein [Actinobacteria bacterium]|nr:glycosyltransferase family 2 protein [Actinomycetota bacterium]
MILSVIIPVFNEEKTVDELLRKVTLVKLPPGFQKEIIVVDDGSTDKSRLVIQNSKLKGIKKIFHEKNAGKGAAIKSGLKAAGGDFIIIQDADLEYNPEDYAKLLQPLLDKKAKVVYGTRLLNYPLKFWGPNKTVLPIHLLANHFLTFLVNLLYGSHLTDMETCYKVFAIEVLSKLDLVSDRFEIEPEITIKTIKLGYDIFEVPIIIKPRGYEEGKKISFSDGVQAVLTILHYRFFKVR